MAMENYERIETTEGRIELEISKGKNHVTLEVRNTQIGDLKTIEIIDETGNEVNIID